MLSDPSQSQESQSSTKFARVAIIGQPNAGKSTLLNRVVGESLAIVTHKVQTTRFAIEGVIARDATQLLFVDTPGIFEPRSEYKLEKFIVKNALKHAERADVFLIMIDGIHLAHLYRKEMAVLSSGKMGDELLELPQSEELRSWVDAHRTLMKKIRHLRDAESRVIFVINKVDRFTLEMEDDLKNGSSEPGRWPDSNSNTGSTSATSSPAQPQINEPDLRKIVGFVRPQYAAVQIISAVNGDGVDQLLNQICELSPEGPWLEDSDYYTNITDQKLAEELTREQIYLQLHKELPYSICVETESWVDDKAKGMITIHQAIYVLKDSQKNIVIGSGGKQIQSIGSRARARIAEHLGCDVQLFLYVTTKPQWIEQLPIERH